jgi:competence protein ComEC
MLIAFAAGIVICLQVKVLSIPLMAAIIGLAIVCIITFIVLNRSDDATFQYKYRMVQGISVALLLACAGFLLTAANTQYIQPAHFSKALKPNSIIVAQITEPPVEKPNFTNGVAEVIEVQNGDTVTAAGGLIQLSSLPGKVEKYHYGDIVLIGSGISETEGPKNPAEFDFKKFLANKNIYHKVFLNENNYKLIRVARGSNFFNFIYRSRAYFLSAIKKYVKDEDGLGVATAMLLGYKDYVSYDLMQAYSGTGVLHILSVSGLHVAIVYGSLFFLLGWMDRRGGKWRMAYMLIMLLTIWFYALITGFSPPVIRSALMLSFITLGKGYNRNINTYNIIAASAVLLLFTNPYLIMDVGFQLSYIAVAGIVFLQPRIKLLLAVKNKIGDWAWALVATSIAAQIITVPLSLYYFHQFPNYFIITNLVVIPLSTVVLYVGMVLFIVSPVPILNDITGYILDLSIKVLNKCIYFFDSLPFAQISGISISYWEMLLVFILLGFIFLLLEVRRTAYLIAALGIVALLTVINGVQRIQQSKQQLIVINAINKQTGISFIEGRNVYYKFSEELSADMRKQKFYIRPYWWQCDIAKEQRLDSSAYKIVDYSFGHLYRFNNKRVLVIDTLLPIINKDLSKLNTDITIITGSPKIRIEQLASLVNTKQLIIDGSNKKYLAAKWKEECAALNLNCYDVMEKGAYVMKQ